jgi:hypothetical protein
MRIVIEADESIIGADRPGREGFVLWNFRGEVNCADCAKNVAEAAYRAAMKVIKENCTGMAEGGEE